MAQQKHSIVRLGFSIAIGFASLAGFATLGWNGAVMYYGLATKVTQVSNSLQIQDQATEIARLRDRTKEQEAMIVTLSTTQRPIDKDWDITSRSWLLMWSGLMKHGNACKSLAEQMNASLGGFTKELSANPGAGSDPATMELLKHSTKMTMSFYEMAQQLVLSSTNSAAMMAGAGVMAKMPYKDKTYFVFTKNPVVGAEITSGEITDFFAETRPEK